MKLICQNVGVKLGHKQVLKQVSFQANKGEITVLLGKNGSGKTTLLKTLASSLLSYSGSIIIGNTPKNLMSNEEQAKIVSYLPQNLSKPAISLDSLLELSRYPYKKAFARLNENDLQIIEDTISKLGLEQLREQLICHLSQGQRQYAYFGFMLCKQGDIYLLDEPCSSLDSSIRKRVYEELKQLSEKGKCILLSMHDLNEALEIANHLVVVDQGVTVFEGNKDEFISHKIYEKYFDVSLYRLHDEKQQEVLLFK